MTSGIISMVAVFDPFTSASTVSTIVSIVGPIFLGTLRLMLPGWRIRREEAHVHAEFKELTKCEKLEMDHERVVYTLALLERLGNRAKSEAERFERTAKYMRALAFSLLVILVAMVANAGLSQTCDQFLRRIHEYNAAVKTVMTQLGIDEQAVAPPTNEPETRR